MRLSRFPIKVLHKLGWLDSLNISSSIKVDQKKLLIPILGGQGYDNLQLSEPWMTNTLRSLRPLFNGHFIDVGVNLGQTLLKAHAVFGHMEYIGFEPNPSCVNYVQELVKLNGIEQCSIFPMGVGTKTEVLKLNFFVSDKSDSSATIVEHYRPNSHEDHFIHVPVFDFHEIQKFLPAKSCPIVKIDVEGAELDVLLGLKEWINEYKPLLIVEILPVYSKENQSRLNRQEQIEDLLKNSSYKISRIRKNGRPGIDRINEIGIHSVIDDSDYLFYPLCIEEQVLNCFA